MGVTGLLGLLKSIQKPCHLKDFGGKTLGVDAYGWLHRGILACGVALALGKPTRAHVDFTLHRVRMLIHFGITPYIVFDGDHLPSKAATEHERAESRDAKRKEGIELLRLGRTTLAHQKLSSSVDVTPEMARQLMDELRAMNVGYVVAPYEADSQLAYLEKEGIIDGIISEDSDLLVFGAKCLLTKLDQYGDCVMIRQADFTRCKDVNMTGWSIAEFRRMAILSGCDYLEGLHRMGLKTAHQLVRKYKTTERVVRAAQVERKMTVPQDYMDKFNQAETTFLYQWVFCPKLGKLVNLHPPAYEGQLDNISYIGQYIEPEIAQKVATGELNPMTKQPIIVPSQTPKTFRTPNHTGKENNASASSSLEKNKSIDSFFKPKRTPLAELDPNSFTPSPSQQRLLQQNGTQPWLARPSPSTAVSSPAGRAGGVISSRTLHTPSSAAPPPKRQRLCSNELDTSPGKPPTKSKFFSPAISVINGSTRSVGKRKKATDIEIWSDDSVDNAMVELADSSFAFNPAETTSTQPDKQLKMTMFTDAAKDRLSDEQETARPEREEDEDESPFSESLRQRTLNLTEKFAFTGNMTANASRNPDISHPNVASSIPHSHRPTISTMNKTATTSKPEPSGETSASFMARPSSHHQHPTLPKAKPQPSSPTKSTSRASGHMQPATQVLNTPPNLHKSSSRASRGLQHLSPRRAGFPNNKGSEDLLLIPNSDDDEEEEREGDVSVIASSPPACPALVGVD